MPDAFIYDTCARRAAAARSTARCTKSPRSISRRKRSPPSKSRNELDTALVDDVVMGVVDPVGEAAADIARTAALGRRLR